jgi:hypothetical protein
VKTSKSINIQQVVIHIIAWSCFAALPYILKGTIPDPPRVGAVPPAPNANATLYFTLLGMLNIPFFYINSEFLIPKFLNKKGLWQYILAIVITIAALFYINGYCKALLFGPHVSRYPRLGTIFQTLFVLAISSSYRIMADNMRKEEIRKEQENERLKSELSFLRSQISPHFMFNVLNSIVSLSRRKPDLVEPVVIKLSELMRYMLYESDGAKVSLEKEVQYLQGYIDLQMIRFGDDVHLTFQKPIIENHQLIEPMLIIPFVENAFKHGVGMIMNPEIHIKLAIQVDELHFEVRNKINSQYKEVKDQSSGIGLNNVSRRLELLYPNQHTLQILSDSDWYSVHLTIKT